MDWLACLYLVPRSFVSFLVHKVGIHPADELYCSQIIMHESTPQKYSVFCGGVLSFVRDVVCYFTRRFGFD